jgi:hypothetical protein
MNVIGEIEMPVKRWWRLLHETAAARRSACCATRLAQCWRYPGSSAVIGFEQWVIVSPTTAMKNASDAQ